jgi:large subunit ribosomal protein L17
MRHRKDHRRLGRKREHRQALLRNLVTALFQYERIETTVAKAKETRRLASA